MGYEGHCESYIASSANWDLAQNLVAAYGTDAGWTKMNALWYGAVQPIASRIPPGVRRPVQRGGQC